MHSRLDKQNFWKSSSCYDFLILKLQNYEWVSCCQFLSRLIVSFNRFFISTICSFDHCIENLIGWKCLKTQLIMIFVEVETHLLPLPAVGFDPPTSQSVSSNLQKILQEFLIRFCLLIKKHVCRNIAKSKDICRNSVLLFSKTTGCDNIIRKNFICGFFPVFKEPIGRRCQKLQLLWTALDTEYRFSPELFVKYFFLKIFCNFRHSSLHICWRKTLRANMLLAFQIEKSCTSSDSSQKLENRSIDWKQNKARKWL